MKRFQVKILVIVLIIIFSVVGNGKPVHAQSGTGFSESFDDPNLPGWDHAREAIVIDGLLHMDPGSFALHFGDWSEIDLSIQCNYSGEGMAAISYYFREGNRYILRIGDGFLELEKEQHGEMEMLGTIDEPLIQPQTWFTIGISFKGSVHKISINDKEVLLINDPSPLETGAILLEAIGGKTIEFDDLVLTGTQGEGPPPVEGQNPPLDQPAEPGLGEPAPGANQINNNSQSGVPTGSDMTTSEGSITTDLFKEFFASQASQLELSTFLVNLVLAAICAYILSLVYIHWGSSLSNRRKFASNFMLMTITTTFIILVVRSSVALSLGLVGALSIVRFRTAVKEPEELAYLFFAIGIGIGLGDNQRLITLLALAFGVVLLGLIRFFRRPDVDINLHLTIADRDPDKIDIDRITNSLSPFVSKMKLMRFDETPDLLEVGFLIELRKGSDIGKVRNSLKELSDTMEMTFMDNKGLW